MVSKNLKGTTMKLLIYSILLLLYLPIDVSAFEVSPNNLKIESGTTATLLIKSYFEVGHDWPIDVKTNIPGSLIMPEAFIPSGKRTVNIPIEGGTPDKGMLFITPLGEPSSIKIPVHVFNAEELKIQEAQKMAAEKAAAMKKAEAERKELEAEKQRELIIIKDFPRVKELGNSMKDKTFVFKSIYLGMPVRDAKTALLATGVGDVQENDYNKTFIKNKIVVEDRTTSHDVISTLKSKEPLLTFGVSNEEKLRIKTEFGLSKISACNGVSKGLYDCPPSDGKVDVIEIYEAGLKDLFNLDDDIDLSTLVKIVSEVYDIEFTRYSSFPLRAYIHVDYDKGFVLRLMSRGGRLNLKLLKIPTPSEIQAAKKTAEEAIKRKIENARSAFD